MNGKHVCKPENAPQVGQVKNLLVLGDKIKNKKPEEGGQPYRIVSVAPDPTYSDAYKNVAFHLVVEPANGQQSTQPHPAASALGRGITKGGGNGGMSKDDYWTRKEERDIEASQRMNRSHAQEMAIRYFTMIGGFGDKSPTEALRTMTDWFQRDSWRTAVKPESEEVF